MWQPLGCLLFIHLFSFSTSWWESLWKQAETVSPDFFIPDYRFELLLGDHQMFPGQLWDSHHLSSRYWVYPGVSFQWDMSDTALMDQGASLQSAQTTSTDSSQLGGAAQTIRESNPSNPVEELYLYHPYLWPYSFGHHPQLMSIGEDRDRALSATDIQPIVLAAPSLNLNSLLSQAQILQCVLLALSYSHICDCSNLQLT